MTIIEEVLLFEVIVKKIKPTINSTIKLRKFDLYVGSFICYCNSEILHEFILWSYFFGLS